MNKIGIRSAIKLMWKIGNKRDKIFFIFLLFAGIIRALSELLIPLITACIVSKLSGERVEILGLYFPDDISLIALIIYCFIILFGVYLICTGIRACVKLFASQMKMKTYLYSMDILLQERKNCDLNMTNGEASYIIKSCSENVENFIEYGLIKVICPMLTSIIAIIYIVILSPISTFVLLTAMILIITAIFTRAYFDGKVFKRMETINADLNNHTLNNIQNLSFISFLKSKNVETRISKSMNNKYYKEDKKRLLIYLIYWGFVYFVQFASAVSVVLLILNTNNIEIQIASTLIIIIPYLLQIFSQIDNLGALIGECQRYGISISQVEKLKAGSNEKLQQIIPPKYKKYEPVKSLPKEEIIKSIELKDVKIKHDKFEKVYNLKFEKGQLNCVVGLSGGGKTTLINILLGTLEHESGNIIINDKYLINNLFFENDRVSISFQGENFFDRSVKNNIMYPETKLNDKAEELSKIFDLEEILNREKDKTENFKDVLSGGEKKRISIIRCISKEAEIYILDEPTNELDEKNVRKTISQLKKLKKNSMVIVVSHDKRVIECSENIVEV